MIAVTSVPMKIPIWTVDAFVDDRDAEAGIKPFSGNPAAVCVLDHYPDADWMQNLAMEMNLSETAFLVADHQSGSFHLRWFTPAVEVDLCGHATLAAAHLLVEKGLAPADDSVRFQTRSGQLQCQSFAGRTRIDFPAVAIGKTVGDDVAREVCAALGIEPVTVHESIFDLVVVVENEAIVRDANVDFNRLSKIKTRGVMVTAPSDEESIAFVSRFFAPQSGINEDPVTGSAHCCLAPYWASVFGRKSLVGFQASGRGGVVHCDVVGDRVWMTGQAVTVMEAQLLISPNGSAR